VLGLTSAVAGCRPVPLVPDGETDGGDGGDGGGACSQVFGPDSVPRLSCSTPQLQTNRDVDILFVIDNSGSMGEEQAGLAASFGAFIDVLESPEVDANYRIGVTTTDNGNPWCTGTTPEGGALVYSSCLDRIPQFTNQQGTLNVGDLACRQSCALTNVDLGIAATSVPWLERVERITNLPAGVSTTEALQCLSPQGIYGCGFESQLESMHKALLRFDAAGDASQGFMREHAVLAVVHVTDEADCSYNAAWTSIFEQAGNRVFWADPSDPFPTSAVCWNAGTACTGDPSSYDCVAQDHDVNGDPIDPGDPQVENDAVLHPLVRYTDRLQRIENHKKETSPDMEVIVALIAGVGDDGRPVYAESADANFMNDFGIGPGCSAAADGPTPCVANADCSGIGTQMCGVNGWCMETQTAVPPVRLAELSDAFDENTKFSICTDDYTPALGAIAETIAAQMSPACFPECAADSDPTTVAIDPDCELAQVEGGSTSTPIVECARNAGGYLLDPATNGFQMPDANTHVCYAARVDADGDLTANPLDDMSTACVDEGFNLEFSIQRRPGFPAPAGARVTATCALSELPGQDCPGL
jgi:hypothetical protein